MASPTQTAGNAPATASTSSLTNCSLDTCPITSSFYMYRIQLAPNIVFLALFALSLFGFMGTFVYKRRGLFFTVAMILGLLCEIIGYAGRIWSYTDQWDMNGFLVQIICLTIGPAFLSAGIYVCLARLVEIYGAENTRIAPRFYTRVFIPCDVISLVLQAAGGGMAAVALQDNDDMDTGDNIMIAGLSFQVFTLVVFAALGIDFTLRVRRRVALMGEPAALDQDPEKVRVRSLPVLKWFIGALGLATLLIIWRSAYRVAELSGGWTGPMMYHQGIFIGMEGVLIVVAVFALNIFHPSVALGPFIISPKKRQRVPRPDSEDMEMNSLQKLEQSP